MKLNKDLTNSTVINTVICIDCGHTEARMTHIPRAFKSGALIEIHENHCFTCLCKPINEMENNHVR